MKKNLVVHFEMPYKDPERVSRFYNKVFGWTMKDAGPSMGNYVVATLPKQIKTTWLKLQEP